MAKLVYVVQYSRPDRSSKMKHAYLPSSFAPTSSPMWIPGKLRHSHPQERSGYELRSMGGSVWEDRQKILAPRTTAQACGSAELLIVGHV
jgi:hypothetical protein